MKNHINEPQNLHPLGNALLVASHPHLRLGRKRSAPKKRLMKFHDLKLARGINPTFQTFDYFAGLPASTGVLNNDRLGCCTASAKYHRLQTVVFKLAGKFLTNDQLAPLALKFYEASTGYDPSQTDAQGNNPTDQGGNMEDIAHFLITNGMLLPGGTTDKFVAAFSIDPTNDLDLSYCGAAGLGIDFGITVTTNVMPADGSNPPLIWQAGGQQLGGHDVFGGKRLQNGNWGVDSWGNIAYQFTPQFREQNVEEAIAYVSADALKNGKTILGMDMAAWTNAMASHGSSVA